MVTYYKQAERNRFTLHSKGNSMANLSIGERGSKHLLNSEHLVLFPIIYTLLALCTFVWESN